MTYIVCVCNACGKTFIICLVFIPSGALMQRYVECPHCKSKDVQEIDIDIKRGSWEKDEKKVENPRLPLMILEYEETLTLTKLTKMVDEHIEKYDSLPSYIKFSKELFDRFSGIFPPDVRFSPDLLNKIEKGHCIEQSFFKYRGEPIEVKVKD